MGNSGISEENVEVFVYVLDDIVESLIQYSFALN